MSEYEDLHGMFVVESSIDQYLQGKTLDGHQTRSMQELTDKHRAANALQLPVDAGTRVQFIANLGSVLSYSDIPDDGMEGTVVTVKTGAGHTTSLDDRVFVQWDDGKFRSILAEHLRRAKTAATLSPRHRSALKWLKQNIGRLRVDENDEDAIHGALIEAGVLKDNDRDLKVVQDILSFARTEMSWTGGTFEKALGNLRFARAAQFQSVRMVVSDLGDLSGFFQASSREDELIHKSTQDLWAFRQDGDQYVIERLFDDTGKPLKV